MIPEQQATPPPNQSVDPIEYLLQAGSFRNEKDADRQRVELILLNLNTHLEKVTLNNGEIWHRVIVGPFHSRSELSKAREVLIGNNIKSLLLKRKT